MQRISRKAAKTQRRKNANGSNEVLNLQVFNTIYPVDPSSARSARYVPEDDLSAFEAELDTLLDENAEVFRRLAQ